MRNASRPACSRSPASRSRASASRAARSRRASAHRQLRGAAPAHRPWADVRALIDAAGLPRARRERARTPSSLRSLAPRRRCTAIEPEEVHFHEVGALDAIGDVCGIALALESLEIEELVCSPLPLAARDRRHRPRTPAAARARDARAAARRPAPRRGRRGRARHADRRRRRRRPRRAASARCRRCAWRRVGYGAGDARARGAPERGARARRRARGTPQRRRRGRRS